MTERSKHRPKLAVWKFSSCDGCQLSLLDCEDELLALSAVRENWRVYGHLRSPVQFDAVIRSAVIAQWPVWSPVGVSAGASSNDGAGAVWSPVGVSAGASSNDGAGAGDGGPSGLAAGAAPWSVEEASRVHFRTVAGVVREAGPLESPFGHVHVPVRWSVGTRCLSAACRVRLRAARRPREVVSFVCRCRLACSPLAGLLSGFRQVGRKGS